MKLYPVRAISSFEPVWKIMLGKRLIALFQMDYSEQLEKIVLMPDVSSEEVLSVLQLGATHVGKYIVNRRHSSMMFNATFTGERSVYVSKAILMEQIIPDEIAAMNSDQILLGLKKSGIETTFAHVRRIGQAIKLALSDPRINIPVNFKLLNSDDAPWQKKVVFTISKKHQFRAWNTVGKGGDDYIVPLYHPDAAANKESKFLINGATEALIGAKAVRSILAPTDKNTYSGSLLSSWSRTQHPYYASGNNVGMSISPTKILSLDGIVELTEVLISLLGIENKYLRVSGGFDAPFSINVPVRNNSFRGTEAHCIWAYNVLQNEGKLENAYVPRWFITEGWSKYQLNK